MYCKNCGTQIQENGRFCPNCGNPVTFRSNPVSESGEMSILAALVKKINTEAMVWIIIAVVQVVAGIIIARVRTDWGVSLIEIEKKYGTYEKSVKEAIQPVCLVWIMAMINIAYAVINFIRANRIKKNPTGIIESYWPILGLEILLICNLLFGCVVGIAGSILGFLTRDFVMKHKMEFSQIEVRFNHK